MPCDDKTWSSEEVRTTEKEREEDEQNKKIEKSKILSDELE